MCLQWWWCWYIWLVSHMKQSKQPLLSVWLKSFHHLVRVYHYNDGKNCLLLCIHHALLLIIFFVYYSLCLFYSYGGTHTVMVIRRVILILVMLVKVLGKSPHEAIQTTTLCLVEFCPSSSWQNLCHHWPILSSIVCSLGEKACCGNTKGEKLWLL